MIIKLYQISSFKRVHDTIILYKQVNNRYKKRITKKYPAKTCSNLTKEAEKNSKELVILLVLTVHNSDSLGISRR